MITSVLSVGDTVVIREKSDEKCSKLQEKYSKWDDNMKELLSDPCQVMEIEGDKIKVKTKTEELLEVNIKLLKIIRQVVFKEGELVEVIQEESRFRELQKGHGGWHNIMKMLMGKDVTVVKVINASIRKIQFLAMEFNVNVACLVRRDKFAVNREVRVIDSEEKVKQLQVGHGEWIDDMRKFLGKKGYVMNICDNKDVVVAFGIIFLRFNPACLETESDIIQRKEMESFIDAIQSRNKASINRIVNATIINKPCPRTGLSPLMITINSDEDGSILQLLLHSGADINAQYENGNTLLHYVVTNKIEKHFDLIMNYDININIQNEFQISTLMIACKIDHEFSFSKLMKRAEIDIHLQDKKGYTALHYAILNSRDSIIISLIEKGSSLKTENEKSFSPFHLLVIRENIKVLEQLLLGGDKSLVNMQKSNDKFSGLHLSAFHGHVDCIRLLLQYGADINLTNSDGETALHIAVLRDYECVKLLCSEMKDINVRDKNGNSPLHKIVKRIPEKELDNIIRIVQCLLQHGADTNLINKNGAIPIEICDHERVKQLLLDHSGIHDVQKPIADVPSDFHELQEKISTIEEEELCKICLDKRKSLVFNCGHNCCQECGIRLQLCHICRCVITNRIMLSR